VLPSLRERHADQQQSRDGRCSTFPVLPSLRARAPIPGCLGSGRLQHLPGAAFIEGWSSRSCPGASCSCSTFPVLPSLRGDNGVGVALAQPRCSTFPVLPSLRAEREPVHVHVAVGCSTFPVLPSLRAVG